MTSKAGNDPLREATAAAAALLPLLDLLLRGSLRSQAAGGNQIEMFGNARGRRKESLRQAAARSGSLPEQTATAECQTQIERGPP